jgi:FixJ family two-component response regulator
MPKGKAKPIVLSGYLRQLLEAEREEIEENVDEYAASRARLKNRGRRLNRKDEERVLVLLRFKAILLAANGWNNKKISDELEISQHTIGKWRRDFSYILSREDLPPQRIIEYFYYITNPVRSVLHEFARAEGVDRRNL